MLIDEKELNSKIGIRIRLLRQMNGISQEELGRQLGVTFQQIQKYESGKNQVSVNKLIKITLYFKVPFLYFTDNIGQQDNQALPITGKEYHKVICLIKKIRENNLEEYKRILNSIIGLVEFIISESCPQLGQVGDQART